MSTLKCEDCGNTVFNDDADAYPRSAHKRWCYTHLRAHERAFRHEIPSGIGVMHLMISGFHTAEDIAHATDAQLLEVANLGHKRLAKLREMIPYAPLPELARDPWGVKHNPALELKYLLGDLTRVLSRQVELLSQTQDVCFRMLGQLNAWEQLEPGPRSDAPPRGGSSTA